MTALVIIIFNFGGAFEYGGLDGKVMIDGIAYEGASKVLTPDGFDASQTLHALGHSAEELTQRSQNALFNQEYWQNNLLFLI